MKKWTRRGFLGASAAVTAIALGRWQGTPAAAANGDVNLYTSRHYETDDRVYEEFTRQTGIRVNLLEGEADELIARILGEGRNSPADLLITVDAARLWRAEQAGIFAPVSSSVLSDRLPENLRHPEGLWFSLTKRARVIMYNKDRVQAGQLSTYENLADPNWRNQIAIRSSSHVYNQSLVASLIEYLGERETEDWCRGLVRNLSRSPQGNDRAQITAAASGQANLAVANTYYLPRYAPGGENADRSASKVCLTFGIPDTARHCACVTGYLPSKNGGTRTGCCGLSSTSRNFSASGEPIRNSPPAIVTISRRTLLPKSSGK